MKKILISFFLFLILNLFCNAQYSPEIQNEINEQFNISRAEEIQMQLPDYSNEFLQEINITNILSVQNLDTTKFFNYIFKLFKNKLAFPIKIIVPMATILIIYSVFSSFCQSNKEVFEFISTCSSCIFASYQIINLSKNAILSLKIASKFVMCFVPIFMTFALSVGQPISASAFNSTILFFNQIIMETTEKLILPINNVMTGLCIISSLSTKIKLNKIFDIFYEIIKWILIFFGTTISFIFSIQKILGSSADDALTKKIKFISNLIPIVGSSLGDATSIFKSSAKILQANIGTFGIISLFSIFLPSIIECLILGFSFQICEFLTQIFEFKNLEILFSSIKKIVNIILAIIMIFLFIFIFVTGSTIK